jgi:5'-nucleotidase
LRILVTNDDGFDAPGIAALCSVAGEFGELITLAPATQQSYVGHRVSTGTPLVLTTLGPNQYHLAGTPADCVRVALRGLGERFDWVFSGINHGGNLGADVYTSGTVAAAREAALLGVPAIALSQFHRRPHPDDWVMSAALARRAIAHIVQEHAAAPAVGYWNVNLPHPVSDAGATAVVECPLDPGALDVTFAREGDEFLYAGRYMDRSCTPGFDVAQCFGGAITLTRFF